MPRARVLLSEASSLTAREFMTVLGRSGVDVEVVTASSLPIARFSRWCSAVHRLPAPSADPIGYLRGVDALMASGRFDALLPTHEQGWLFAAGRRYLPHANAAVATVEAFDRVVSKVALARTLDEIGLPQPAWRPIDGDADLDALGYPVWVKASFSNSGRGVRHAVDRTEAVEAWREFSGGGPVMVQASAAGRYAQVQGVFDQGRLLAAAVSEQLAVGAGGSAAARVSVDHPLAVDALTKLGAHLGWHGGLNLDYFHENGAPSFIECNPRIAEPGNAAVAGVDLPRVMIDLAAGRSGDAAPVIARPGVRTRSTMAIALGAAERYGTRRAIARSIWTSATRQQNLHGSVEVLTPVLRDPVSLLSFVVATGTVLARPSRVAALAGDTSAVYSMTPAAVELVRE